MRSRVIGASASRWGGVELVGVPCCCSGSGIQSPGAELLWGGSWRGSWSRPVLGCSSPRPVPQRLTCPPEVSLSPQRSACLPRGRPVSPEVGLSPGGRPVSLEVSLSAQGSAISPEVSLSPRGRPPHEARAPCPGERGEHQNETGFPPPGPERPSLLRCMVTPRAGMQAWSPSVMLRADPDSAQARAGRGPERFCARSP